MGYYLLPITYYLLPSSLQSVTAKEKQMIEIKPIQLHQVEEVKQIIFAVCHEIWQVTEEEIRRYDAMSDIDDVQSHYFDNSGTFLVLIDDGRVVGSGAIRRLNNDICELKRMWLIKDYRGRGLGTKMTQMLLYFAQKTGYKKVRLDLLDEQKQIQALKLYKRLGFYFIERYNDGFCTVFMEKML
jgi:putative acetyltransferase